MRRKWLGGYKMSNYICTGITNINVLVASSTSGAESESVNYLLNGLTRGQPIEGTKQRVSL